MCRNIRSLKETLNIDQALAARGYARTQSWQNITEYGAKGNFGLIIQRGIFWFAFGQHCPQCVPNFLVKSEGNEAGVDFANGHRVPNGLHMGNVEQNAHYAVDQLNQQMCLKL